VTLSPDGCAALYDAIRMHPPFCRWSLPESDEIEFHVVRDRKIFGQYHYGDDHAIAISETVVGHWSTLSSTMAHEMIHLYQNLNNRQTKAEHNVEFRKLASEVCAEFGFDPRCF
jgi:hypothetical protein